MKWGIAKANRYPENGIDLFRNEVSRLFDDFFSLKPTTLFETTWAPTVDVDEDDKAIHVRAEIPGIDEKDLSVTLENNTLTISGEKKEERREEDKNKRAIYSERRFGSFCRTIALPAGIKSDKIRAAFKKGVLNIEVPKDEAIEPKKVKIDVK